MGEAKRKNKQTGSYRAKKAKTAATMIIVVTVLAVIVGMDVAQRMKSSPLKNFIPERTKGSNADAPLQILEFADFQCSQCAVGARLLNQYITKYPEGIRLSVKYYPLGQLNSQASAVYAECAAKQNKFWKFHDLLFERQNEWRTLLRIDRYFERLAKEANLNLEQLQTCAKSDKTKEIVQKDKTLGESHFVKSTPTYFINGEIVVGVGNLRSRLENYFEKQQEL